MKRVLVLIMMAGVVCWLTSQAPAAHSTYGCFHCHVPHHAGDPNDPTDYGVPLWSTEQNSDGLPTFTLYSSKGFDKLGTDISQPTGPSKLCLGCHDGSYSHVSPEGTRIFLPGDLARSHPVSFTYDTALANKVPNSALRDPNTAMSGFGGTIAQDLLDIKGKMQCTSCHDVHTTGWTENLLRWNTPAQGGEATTCKTCHNK